MTAAVTAARPLPVVAERKATVAPLTARISITDRCDLACVYCRPSRHDGRLASHLEPAAWGAMLDGLQRAGIRRIRLTGGEPLVHPEVVRLVRAVAARGFEDVALTTNGTQLAALARPLRDAGLRRLTVSLDSLDPQRFFRLTRGGRLTRVVEGLEAARDAGFDEVKTNTVVLRGENDDELAAITRWAWARDVVPRFIELMRVGEGAHLPAKALVSVAEMRLALRGLLEEGTGERDPGRGPATYVRGSGLHGRRVGFISGSSDPFCAGCDRLRVSAAGVVHPCLALNVGVDAGAAARDGAPERVAEAVGQAWRHKPDGSTWAGCNEATASSVAMRAIGG